MQKKNIIHNNPQSTFYILQIINVEMSIHTFG